jgi:glycosyltransferase involved in cell wall biosynthesis
MLRTFDERGGVAVYSRNLVGTLLAIDRKNDYEIFYRSAEHRGLFGACPNVTEHVVRSFGKAHWDQVAIPGVCRQRRVDVLLHPKFTVPLLAAVPSVMVVHGADWFLPEGAAFYTPLDRAYMRLFLPLYLRKAAAVISVSQLTTEDFVRIFPDCRHKIETVYFGPAAHFRRETDRERIAEVRRKYGLPERYVLTLQKLGGDTRKNLRGILEAWRLVHGRIEQKLVVGGLGCERFRRDYSIPDDGWGSSIVFPGYLDQADLPAIYTASELLLYPSNLEAFPIPITEAMRCGVPIVTSRINGLAEIAGDAAILVDPGKSGRYCRRHLSRAYRAGAAGAIVGTRAGARPAVFVGELCPAYARNPRTRRVGAIAQRAGRTADLRGTV